MLFYFKIENVFDGPALKKHGSDTKTLLYWLYKLNQ